MAVRSLLRRCKQYFTRVCTKYKLGTGNDWYVETLCCQMLLHRCEVGP